MKKISLILLLTLFSTFGFAQMVSKTTGTPSDFRKMKTKTLVVELLEEGGKDVLSKMDAKDHKAYKALIKSYNEHIKNAVEKVWKINTSIVYKTSTQVDEIIKNKNDEFVLLTYYEHGQYMGGSIIGDKSFYDYAGVRYRLRNRAVPVINYVSPSSEQQNPELYAGLPARSFVKHNLYREKDLIFTLRNLQNNINEIIKTNKHIKPDKYIINSAELNCHKLSDKTFLLNKSETYNLNLEKAKKAYIYKLKVTDFETIELAIANKETDKAYSILLPYALSGNFLVYFKLIVDVDSGDILAFSKSLKPFVIGELKKLSKCK